MVRYAIVIDVERKLATKVTIIKSIFFIFSSIQHKTQHFYYYSETFTRLGYYVKCNNVSFFKNKTDIAYSYI